MDKKFEEIFDRNNAKYIELGANHAKQMILNSLKEMDASCSILAVVNALEKVKFIIKQDEKYFSLIARDMTKPDKLNKFKFISDK